MDQPIPDELARAIVQRHAILFAGAGLSMSVGLPSWQQLIDHMADELGLDAREFRAPNVGYHTLAEYFRIKQGSIGPLRSWMDRKWKVSAEKVRSSKIHQLVVALDFPLLYTTNYDRNLEEAFGASGRDYVKIANARDIAKTREGIPQIVKFHGDFDEDDSLVITETDYFNRLAFDSPLDIKFHCDALGKTVLFVGYSMSDLNIRLLLHNLWRTWRASGYERDRPKSYVFMAQEEPIQKAILDQWGITVLEGECANPQEALSSFLTRLNERVNELRKRPAARPAALSMARGSEQRSRCRNEPHSGAFGVQEGLNMNREHVKAAARKGQGTVKQIVAEVTGDYKLDAEGKLDKLIGASHDVAGEAKDAAIKGLKK